MAVLRLRFEGIKSKIDIDKSIILDRKYEFGKVECIWMGEDKNVVHCNFLNCTTLENLLIVELLDLEDCEATIGQFETCD